MSDHVHEWEFNTVEVMDAHAFGQIEPIFQVLSAVASCKLCDMNMGPSAMERRRNATERLSADMASQAARLIASEYDYQWHLGSEEKYKDSPWKPRMDALVAYAVALDGE